LEIPNFAEYFANLTDGPEMVPPGSPTYRHSHSQGCRYRTQHGPWQWHGRPVAAPQLLSIPRGFLGNWLPNEPCHFSNKYSSFWAGLHGPHSSAYFPILYMYPPSDSAINCFKQKAFGSRKMLLLTNGMWEVITPTCSGAETVFQTCAVVISHIIPISWFPHYLNVYL
jgi:hypothetical protein